MSGKAPCITIAEKEVHGKYIDGNTLTAAMYLNGNEQPSAVWYFYGTYWAWQVPGNVSASIGDARIENVLNRDPSYCDIAITNDDNESLKRYFHSDDDMPGVTIMDAQHAKNVEKKMRHEERLEARSKALLAKMPDFDIDVKRAIAESRPDNVYLWFSSDGKKNGKLHCHCDACDSDFDAEKGQYKHNEYKICKVCGRMMKAKNRRFGTKSLYRGRRFIVYKVCDDGSLWFKRLYVGYEFPNGVFTPKTNLSDIFLVTKESAYHWKNWVDYRNMYSELKICKSCDIESSLYYSTGYGREVADVCKVHTRGAAGHEVHGAVGESGSPRWLPI